MTEEEWFACEEPAQMLRVAMLSERRRTLFACAWWSAWPPHREHDEYLVREIEEQGNFCVLGARWEADDLLFYCSSNPRIQQVGVSLLREIAGNPFEPLLRWEDGHLQQFAGWAQHGFAWPTSYWEPVSWLSWNEGTVATLATTIYEERSWELMPVLADALEDAGCTNRVVLEYCRGSDHVRGCWLLDSLRGVL